MARKIVIMCLIALMLSVGSVIFAQTMVTLDQAIGYGVSEIENRLDPGVKVMVLNFSSPSQSLSNDVLDEMVAMLTQNRKLTVVDSVDLDFLLRELNLQRSGEINDESARSIGRILGAQYVISGGIEESGSDYIVQFRTMAVEPVALQTLTRVGIRRDAQIVGLMAAGTSTQTTVGTSTQTVADTSSSSENDTSSESKTLVLSTGGGGYGKFELIHGIPYTGSFSVSNLKTTMSLGFGGSLFLDAEIIKYILVELSPFYRYTRSIGEGSTGGTGNFGYVGASLSLFGQYPKQLTDRIRLIPLLGVGYEMAFYGWAKGGNGSRKQFTNNFDFLTVKPGVGLNYNLTGNLVLNGRFTWDIVLYSGLASAKKKSAALSGSKYLELRHGPDLFIGVSYVFLEI